MAGATKAAEPAKPATTSASGAALARSAEKVLIKSFIEDLCQ
jgi:hypothetical protein